MRLIAVAVPVPTLDALTYSVPEGVPMPVIGARVLVPLGNRTLTGIVVDIPESQAATGAPDRAPEPEFLPTAPGNSGGEPGTPNPEPEIRPLTAILDDTPFLPADVVKLASWVASYYAAGAGEAMATAMPPRAWVESERYAQITDLGEARLLTERGARRRVLEALSGAKPVRMDSLLGAGKGGASHAVLLGLERDGLVRITQPLKGAADASRTIRIASLTAQGHDAAAASARRDGATPQDAPPLKLGARQREALALLQGAPEGLETT
jgi:primosomal protein N' (replication factor Y) (superfamily II helicase)